MITFVSVTSSVSGSDSVAYLPSDNRRSLSSNPPQNTFKLCIDSSNGAYNRCTTSTVAMHHSIHFASFD